MLTLDLALITHKPEGIQRIAKMNLPEIEGVRYVVSWQAHGDAPVPDSLASRPDVEIHRFDKPGQSLNRNNAIEHCTADIILHSDDDLIYSPEGLKSLIGVFERNPKVDVATFRSVHEVAGRIFPDIPTDLNRQWPKNYMVATVEIAFRRSTAGGLRCCPELGLGSERYHGGEDEIFLLTALKRGLQCYFFPITICEHPQPSTGTKSKLTDGNLRSSGCVIGLTYPRTAFLRVPLKAWRVSRAKQAGFFRALRLIASGAIGSRGVLKRNRATLW